VFAVELADADRLASMDAGALASLRGALASSGLDARFLARLARIGERLDDPMRAPMRAWNARRMPEPAAVLARLFVLHDPVTPAEATRALGPLVPFVDAGLLEVTGDVASSRARLAFAGELAVFGDKTAEGDGVPPLNGVTPVLARTALPGRRTDAPHAPLGAALDLGCGAGAIALALAAVAGRVVATDVNPRALAWTRFNARLNGIGRVEVRLGDGYAPARGERFDRVVSQPPFLARRPGAARSGFAHGGPRGDELALRVIAGAAAHLTPGTPGTPGGRAVVLADWPLLDAESIDARVRAAIAGAAVGAVVLASPPKNLDEYCTSVAAAEHPALGDAFAAAACAQRDHFEDLGLRGIAQALVVVDATLARRTALVAVRHAQDAPITAADVDRVVAAQALAATEGLAALLAARLRFPPGTRLVDQPPVHGAPAAVILQLPPTRPEWPHVVPPTTATILSAIHRAPTVEEGARPLTAQGIPLEAILEATRQALVTGALERGD